MPIFILPNTFTFLGFSTYWCVCDEDYSRNTSYALNLISMFLWERKVNKTRTESWDKLLHDNQRLVHHTCQPLLIVWSQIFMIDAVCQNCHFCNTFNFHINWTLTCLKLIVEWNSSCFTQFSKSNHFITITIRLAFCL